MCNTDFVMIMRSQQHNQTQVPFSKLHTCTCIHFITTTRGQEALVLYRSSEFVFYRVENINCPINIHYHIRRTCKIFVFYILTFAIRAHISCRSGVPHPNFLRPESYRSAAKLISKGKFVNFCPVPKKLISLKKKG